ncbi:hypothetical protein [Muribaculum intestinale]|uniref:hypothetical protein n=1 Tax=Muribaculum intestinale TaxID=1796646 RepID=UPI0025B7732A|nr:hypothetical protein [Muribaculum intestinale]
MNWWLITIVIVILITIISTLTDTNDILNEWAESLTKLLTPTSIILGLILGYPLLKKKLTESYIAKQFDIMDNANRAVRTKCIELQDKYSQAKRSNHITIEYIAEAQDDFLELRQKAIDAAPDVYKYANLIYQSLSNLYEIYERQDKEQVFDYKEQLSTWLNEQTHEIYDYSKSVGCIPTGMTKSKKRLNKRLSEFVSGNSFIEVGDIDHSIDYLHSAAMLVIFYGKNNHIFDYNNINYFLACYKSAPSPSPFARLMYNSAIYFPPVLRGQKKLIFHYPELFLIGYSRRISSSPKGEERYYICTYANMSNVSFVIGTIHNLDSLTEYKDGYLDIPFSIENLSDFSKTSEVIQFRISVEEAEKRYNDGIGYRLQSRLKDEIKYYHK